MQQIIITTPDQLKTLISEAIGSKIIRQEIPPFVPILYQQNPETAYYTKSEVQLTLQSYTTFRDELSGNSLSGILPVTAPDWYIGYHYNLKVTTNKLSVILFYFYPDKNSMLAFYFPGLRLMQNEERERFAVNYIPYLTTIYQL